MAGNKALRGTCRVCRFRFRLRRDGTVGEHKVYFGFEQERCAGSGLGPLSEDKD